MKGSTEKRKEYRRKWMQAWRKKNKEKVKEIQTRYWKNRIEKLDKEFEILSSTPPERSVEG